MHHKREYMKREFLIIIFATITLNAMDKEGEILCYRYTVGNERIKRFEQSLGNKQYIITRIKNLSTDEVRWEGEVLERSCFKIKPRSKLLAGPCAKSYYAALQKKFKDHTSIASEDEFIKLLEVNEQPGSNEEDEQEEQQGFIIPLGSEHNEPFHGKLPDAIDTLLDQKNQK